MQSVAQNTLYRRLYERNQFNILTFIPLALKTLHNCRHCVVRFEICISVLRQHFMEVLGSEFLELK